MNWIILIIAGLFEVAFAASLGQAKLATGNKMYFWYACFGITLTISMALLIKATQTLPIGTAYAVWTGIGAVGTVVGARPLNWPICGTYTGGVVGGVVEAAAACLFFSSCIY